MASSASAWATVRGKPSRMKPFRASGSCSRVLMMSIISVPGTSSPRSMYPLPCSPGADPARRWARSISPVATAGMWLVSIRDPVCVPLPAPGAPKRIKFIGTARDLRSLLYEPLVLTHDQLRLDLFHGVERNADHDQDRRAAEVHVLRRYSGQRGR